MYIHSYLGLSPPVHGVQYVYMLPYLIRDSQRFGPLPLTDRGQSCAVTLFVLVVFWLLFRSVPFAL